MGSNLILRRGNASEILQELMNETGALDVYWSRAYDPASIHRDTKVKSLLNGTSLKAMFFLSHGCQKLNQVKILKFTLHFGVTLAHN